MSTVVFFEGPSDVQGKVVAARAGQSVMRAAIAAGIEGIAADCGGTLSCATCHVMVRESWLARLPAMSDEEHAMLEFTACARQPNSRLSCQIPMSAELDGLQLDLPPRQY